MSDDTEAIAAGGFLGDLALLPLPESAIPLEAIVLVKALDENGEACWFTRYTENLSQMEAVGALSVAHQLAFDGVMECYVYESGDEDEGD